MLVVYCSPWVSDDIEWQAMREVKRRLGRVLALSPVCLHGSVLMGSTNIHIAHTHTDTTIVPTSKANHYQKTIPQQRGSFTKMHMYTAQDTRVHAHT